MATVYPSDPPEDFPALAPPLKREIAGFWRRLGAYIVDWIIVGIAAFIITIPFTETLSKLGAYGPVLGVLLTLPYYAILNSGIGNGQTLGKRWLDIQVVDQSGNTISFAKSILRYAALAIPFFLDNVTLPNTRIPLFVPTLMSALGALSFATLYLLVFNRRTRQGLHDLAAKSFVVYTDLNGPPDVKPFWKPHWLILACVLVLGYAGSSLFAKQFLRNIPIAQMSDDLRVVEQMKNVQSASVMVQTTFTGGEEGSRRSLVFTIIWTGNSDDRSAFADQVARAILSMDRSAFKYDTLKINLVRGYDLVITHWRRSYYFEHSPSEWNTRLTGDYSKGQAPSKL